ncbi:MAG: HipA domain-containing protein [Saprospiraceae bacterium]
MNDFAKCLFCGESLPDGAADFHPSCSRKFFGSPTAPELPYSLGELHELAQHIVERSIAVTGVQPKLSLAFEKNVREGISRLTLVGLWGDYILKPPNAQFPELVENEQLTMSLAQVFGIETVPFSLIRLRSGELAYLTRRIDRSRAGKLQMEDFCQLSERLTEYKYRGSVEQIAKVIRRFSSNPGLDVANFVEVVVFCFLTGNADMHLKNYSLLTLPDGDIRLAPAYDLVATTLAMPTDPEESALTVNGKRSRLTLADFAAFAAHAGLPEAVFKKILQKMQRKMPAAQAKIGQSWLSDDMKTAYRKMLEERLARLEGG